MDKDILWATMIVDRKAEFDQQQQKCRTRARKLGILIMDDTKDGRDLSNESLNPNFANIQVEERVRKTSSDLRHEIVELGGAENITELRLRKKMKNKAAKLSNLTNIHVGPLDCENFLKAATNGNLKVVDKFLEDGGDPNTADEFRKSGLHRAAFEGHVKIVERLLDKGASIDFQDRLACTAVHWACRGGSLAALKLLQSRGADLNVKDKLLSTPLHVATRTGHWEVVEHLVSSGVRINAKDWEGDTALHDAVRLNRYKIVKSLILAGADMKIKNAEGVTATEQVKMWQCDTKEMLEKLEQMK
ncbi:ankyrin repeat domain-containing protein 2 [Ictalurus furcatus]|uniref:ankyrin repeat domain-containing protein 2 n=1 Tax=Ictalurus furcatus TaxID=66913 RepID=UPI002350D002|nr:ankyrin repeat domain-containing protein 2 [Ictalurus furcatus]XP_053477192.1 ankyrin repeat domain-containing protein 2 [Ictalurus furcatus]